jgi:4-hydroxybenzoate polyprenyltransferase
MSSIRAFFQLVRVPNLFTALADILAGFLFVGGTGDDLRALIILAVASVSFYAGGVALNDVMDVDRDTASRSTRPIPSGAISRRVAAIIAVSLLALGVCLCFTLHGPPRALGLGLAVCIVCYDVLLKQTVVAPAAMGACRALNLLLGMGIVEHLTTAPNVMAAVLIWLYVASVTHYARTEAVQSSPWRLGTGVAGVFIAVAGLLGLSAVLEHSHISYVFLVGVLLGRVALAARRSLRTAAAIDVQYATKVFVQSLIVFDACLVMAARGPWLAAAVLLLLVPSAMLATKFKVT